MRSVSTETKKKKNWLEVLVTCKLKETINFGAEKIFKISVYSCRSSRKDTEIVPKGMKKSQ